MSKTYLDLLKEKDIPALGNDNIWPVVKQQDIIENVEQACQKLLEALVIDTENDHNTRETAKRMAKMFVYETFAGRYTQVPDTTSFPNAKELDDMYMVGPITINSTCSHHLAPIVGKAWIGVLAGENVIGLSKFKRIADWICGRPQIQEEMAVQLADYLEQELSPRGLAVCIKATHMCMSYRGVKDPDSIMTTNVMRGELRTNHNLKQEFLQSVKL